MSIRDISTHDIFSSDDENSARNVAVFLSDMDSFDTTVQHQIGKLIYRSVIKFLVKTFLVKH